MKKTLVLFLVILVCISLCACGGDTDTAKTTDTTEQDNIDILGEWVWVGDKSNTITFNEDGTCQYSSGHSAKYSVNYDLLIITIYDTLTINYNIVSDSGIIKLSSSADYVREENYENAHAEYEAEVNAQIQAEHTQMQAKIDEFYSKGKENREELVFGKSYAINEATNIVFQSCALGEYDEELNLYPVDFDIILENNSDTKICIRAGYNKNDDNSFSFVESEFNELVDCVVLDKTEAHFSLTIVLENDTASGYDVRPIYLEPNSVDEYSATTANFRYSTGYQNDEYDVTNHQQYIIITCADKELFLNVTDLIDQTK